MEGIGNATQFPEEGDPPRVLLQPLVIKESAEAMDVDQYTPSQQPAGQAGLTMRPDAHLAFSGSCNPQQPSTSYQMQQLSQSELRAAGSVACSPASGSDAGPRPGHGAGGLWPTSGLLSRPSTTQSQSGADDRSGGEAGLIRPPSTSTPPGAQGTAQESVGATGPHVSHMDEDSGGPAVPPTGAGDGGALLGPPPTGPELCGVSGSDRGFTSMRCTCPGSSLAAAADGYSDWRFGQPDSHGPHLSEAGAGAGAGAGGGASSADMLDPGPTSCGLGDEAAVDAAAGGPLPDARCQQPPRSPALPRCDDRSGAAAAADTGAGPCGQPGVVDADAASSDENVHDDGASGGHYGLGLNLLAYGSDDDDDGTAAAGAATSAAAAAAAAAGGADPRAAAPVATAAAARPSACRQPSETDVEMAEGMFDSGSDDDGGAAAAVRPYGEVHPHGHGLQLQRRGEIPCYLEYRRRHVPHEHAPFRFNGVAAACTATAGGASTSAAAAAGGGGAAGDASGSSLRLACRPEQVKADEWSEDDEEEADTTAEQLYAAEHPKDIQGIPWDRLQFNRATYRDTRLRQYRNYTNVLPDDDGGAYRAELAPLCAAPRRGATAGAASCGPPFFAFVRNSRAVQSNIVHFQLRNLVWALSPNDVFVVHDNCVNHWNPVGRTVREVLNLNGSGGNLDGEPGGGGGGGAGAGRGGASSRLMGLGRVQVSTLCVVGDLVAAGGFMGELVVRRLRGEQAGSGPAGGTAEQRRRRGVRKAGSAGAGEGGGGGGLQGKLLHCGRITSSDNGITNGLEIFPHASHGTVVMAANNDAQLRLFAAAGGEGSLRQLAAWPFDWAVNYATVRPGGSGAPLAAVVGDDPATLLTDVHNGVTAAKLHGHRDFSFAAAWHPGGTLLATGNQDTTTLLWDIRRTGEPLTRLAGRMGAIRSLRFSPDGRFLAMSEPADFVHIYDVASGFLHCQEHDFFGEIAGVSFTPDSSTLFVGVSDLTYASLMQLERQRCEWV